MNEVIIDEDIKNKIYTIRDMQVMLDSDLAKLYDVESKRLNEQVKRNIARFPQQFRFQLTEEEYQNLRSQFATSSSNDSLRSQFATLENMRGKHRKYLPYVFTEQGVSMLSAVLKSDKAIQTSIHIINSFVKMRQFLSHSGDVFKRLELVEKRQITYEIKTDKKFENSHDRFLILDDKELYHIGASLKDLGKKWFAFSKMDLRSFDVLEKLET